MKYLILAVALASTSAIARDTYVQPYVRSDGTVVQGHYRSAPDRNPYNNYGTQGNVNPYTGQAGHTNPYQQPQYQPVQPQQQPLYGQPGYCNPFHQRC